MSAPFTQEARPTMRVDSYPFDQPIRHYDQLQRLRAIKSRLVAITRCFLQGSRLTHLDSYTQNLRSRPSNAPLCLSSYLKCRGRRVSPGGTVMGSAFYFRKGLRLEASGGNTVENLTRALKYRRTRSMSSRVKILLVSARSDASTGILAENIFGSP